MKKFTFTKEHTEIVKGLAILLMLVHHLFGFPEWYADGVSYIGIPLRAHNLEYVVAQFGHICVSIFAFITGYGMFFSYKGGNVFKKSVKKGVSFLLSYWLVLFLVAIPVNLLLGKKDITLSLVWGNLFGYDNTLVSFAWYVRFYLEMLITLPLFYRMMTKRSWVTIPMFLLTPILVNYYLGMVSSSDELVGKVVYFSMEYFLWITTALMGLCFARYGLFEKLGKLFSKLGKLEYLVCIVLMGLLVYLRAYKEDTVENVFSFDCIYAPIFVFLAVKLIEAISGIQAVLKGLGAQSMNLWFLHSLFFFRTAELMKYAYAPRISVLILLWVIVLCLPVAWALSKLSGLLLGGKREEREKQAKEGPLLKEDVESKDVVTVGKTNAEI